MPETKNPAEIDTPLDASSAAASEPPRAPQPSAVGDSRIEILKHDLSASDPVEQLPTPAGVELAIRNISNSHIATAAFEVLFFDETGQVISTVKHNEVELAPGNSRALRINSSIPHYESARVSSYALRIVRTTTTDVERIQIRRHEIRTIETGEEGVWGIVKNISDRQTDAAVVWTFLDPKKENIGIRVVILRDIEPNSIRQYEFKFKPPEGETVRSYSIAVGEIVE